VDNSGTLSRGDTLFICLYPGTSSSTYYGLYHSVYNGTEWDPGWKAE
jgi:hypothetical protein